MNNINTGTIVRTVILALALINQLLTATGHSVINIVDNTVTQVVTTLVTVITAVWAWWKNNSFTQKAIKADEKLKELKGK